MINKNTTLFKYTNNTEYNIGDNVEVVITYGEVTPITHNIILHVVEQSTTCFSCKDCWFSQFLCTNRLCKDKYRKDNTNIIYKKIDKKKLSKICVLGGSGFIGSNFIHTILDKNLYDRVLNIDKHSYASHNIVNNKYRNDKRYMVIQQDITSNNVKEILNRFNPDVIVNFASESHVDTSISSPDEFITNNIKIAQVLAEYLRNAKENGNNIRFHHVGTDEVYGDFTEYDNLPNHNSKGFITSSPIYPSSPYSASKASQDMIFMAYARTYDLDITISRCSNNFGKYQHHEKMIPLIVKNLMHNLPIPVYGDGKQTRDWIPVSLHVDGILKILNKDMNNINTNHDRIFNIGGGKEMTNLELINRIGTILNITPNIQYISDRKGHDIKYCITDSIIKYYKQTTWDEKFNETIILSSLKYQHINSVALWLNKWEGDVWKCTKTSTSNKSFNGYIMPVVIENNDNGVVISFKQYDKDGKKIERYWIRPNILALIRYKNNTFTLRRFKSLFSNELKKYGAQNNVGVYAKQLIR